MRYAFLTVLLLAACVSANGPTPSAQPVNTVASASPLATSKPSSASPADTSEPATSPIASPTVTSSKAPMAGNGVSAAELERIASVRLSSQNDRFLDAKNETTQFTVVFIDKLGQEIAASTLSNVVLNWESSRPQDFSVDAEGNLKALVEFGFADIIVRLADTDLEARTRISVNATQFSGGGGGGSSNTNTGPVNTAPTINSLQTSSTNIIGTGTPVQLTATASDVESTLTNAQFSWRCLEAACQGFNAIGPKVVWNSPATSGGYTLQLTVTDGSLSAQQNIVVNVVTGKGKVNF